MVADRSTRSGRALAYLMLALGAVVLVAPFWFSMVFATHDREQIFSSPPPLWFGQHFMANLELLNSKLPFWRNVWNSVYVALATTALNLVLCSLAGFGFAVYEFRFKNALFTLVVASMMVPSFLNMIPSYLVINALGWVDQPRALYIPAGASALGIFMMRQYISSAIPHELLDAARMDGCTEFGVFRRVVAPLLGPALGTLGLITFIASWNNFVSPLVVLRSAEQYTLPLALRSIQSPTNTEWGALMAGSAVAMLPLLLAFFFFAKRLVAGLTAGAVRG